MDIEIELMRKWQIDADPVFGSGSIADIQTLCNECAALRNQNNRHLSRIHAAHGLLAPLGNQVTPSVMAIREALSILRGAM